MQYCAKSSCRRWSSVRVRGAVTRGVVIALEVPEGNRMELTAEYLSDWRFEIVSGRHRIACDQPYENGGADSGMSPPEFLLASLASCAAYYAVQYLKVRHLPADNLKIRVTAEKARQPARLDSFRIEVMAPGLDERHETGILRAVKACLIHNTLLAQPSIEIVINTTAVVRG
jgi:putative redox protein